MGTNNSVGAVGHARVDLDSKRAHVCATCSTILRAEIRSSGSSFAYTPFQQAAEQIADDAWWGAFRDARSEADLLVRLAECPRCQARGRVALRLLRIQGVVLGLAGALLFSCVSFVVTEVLRLGWTAVVPFTAAGLGGLAVGRGHVRKVLRRADELVRLVIDY